jgi:hypothetical protein
MEPEHAYLAALSVVWLALVGVVKKLWDRSQECEQWRKEKEPVLMRMEKMLGLAEGTLSLVDECHIKGCPFAGKMPESFAVNGNKQNKS